MALFSKRHYEAIASELRAIRMTIETLADNGERLGTVVCIVAKLADAFARDNAKFNRAQFIEACKNER